MYYAIENNSLFLLTSLGALEIKLAENDLGAHSLSHLLEFREVTKEEFDEMNVLYLEERAFAHGTVN